VSGTAPEGTDAPAAVGSRLESLARSLCSSALFYTDSPEAFVDAQLALTLEHLERQRILQRVLCKQLVTAECALDTLLLPFDNSYRPRDPTLEGWVRDRLLSLGQEGRRIAMDTERAVEVLEAQLLQLVTQRFMLGGRRAQR
jgi:hypothetical protein